MEVSKSPSTIPSIEEMTREEREFTERMLLAMANDVALLNKTTERVVTMIRTLAIQYRVPIDLNEAA